MIKQDMKYAAPTSLRVWFEAVGENDPKTPTSSNTVASHANGQAGLITTQFRILGMQVVSPVLGS